VVVNLEAKILYGKLKMHTKCLDYNKKRRLCLKNTRIYTAGHLERIEGEAPNPKGPSWIRQTVGFNSPCEMVFEILYMKFQFFQMQNLDVLR
jgi:hypothetical protein